MVNIANDQRTLKEIENKILYMLANASGKNEPAEIHLEWAFRCNFTHTKVIKKQAKGR